ncbi:MAG: hypothetical protein ACRCY9_06360, partial [Phycicoccus sp.]
MPDIIDNIEYPNRVFAPGESFRISVDTSAAEAVVAIDGVRGPAQYVQAPRKVGVHEIVVAAATADGGVESQTITVRVGDLPDLPRLVMERDPYRPFAAALSLADAAPATPTNAERPATMYRWDIADSSVTTDVPVLIYDFESLVDHRQQFTMIDVHVTPLAPGTGAVSEDERGDVGVQSGPDPSTETVSRTLTVWSAYRLMRDLGVVQPLVETEGIAYRGSDGKYAGSLKLRNVEDQRVTITSHQIEWITSDPDGEPVVEAAERFDLVV